jgi:hypothetical protein
VSTMSWLHLRLAGAACSLGGGNGLNTQSGVFCWCLWLLFFVKAALEIMRGVVPHLPHRQRGQLALCCLPL